MKYEQFTSRDHFTKTELLGLGHGTLVEDPPPEFIRLPAPPMLMVDRVTELVRAGRGGRIVGEQDIALDDWFFQCHFRGDPVQPGCLGVDAVWQLVGLFCAASGAPGSGRALGCKEVTFDGQIRPYNKLVRYEITITRLQRVGDTGAAIAIGDALVTVDGELIYTIKGARTGMFPGIAYPDYPHQSARSVGGMVRVAER